MAAIADRVMVRKLHPLFVPGITGIDITVSPEGRRMIEALTAFCTQPQFVHSPPWREHDMVIWDNRCTLHRATPFDKTKCHRKLHRTAVVRRAPDTVLARMPERAESA